MSVSELADRLQSDLVAAMKAREADTVSTLRLAIAAVKNLRTSEGRGGADVTDAEVVDLLTREAKKRGEAAEAYAQAGRDDLAGKERRELAVLRRYLPEQLPEDEVRRLVADAVAEAGAAGPGDLGRVMSALMPKVKGRADGKLVNALVREALG